MKDKHGINAFEYENFGCNRIDVVKSNRCKLYKIHEGPRQEERSFQRYKSSKVFVMDVCPMMLYK